MSRQALLPFAALLLLAAPGLAAAAPRAVIERGDLAPNSIDSARVVDRSLRTVDLNPSVLASFHGRGPVRDRPVASRANVGLLYFATDVDGGALFRSAGTKWEQVTTGLSGRLAIGAIVTSRIAHGAVTTPKLADAVITPEKVAPSTWQHASSSGALADRPASSARPDGSMYFATDDGAGALHQNAPGGWRVVGRLGGASELADSSITTAKLRAGAVTASVLAANSVGSDALAANSVTANAIAGGSISSDKLAVGAVGPTQLSAAAVGGVQLAPGAVSTAHIAPGAVTTARLAPGAVATTSVADSAITAAKLAADSVSSGSVLDGSIGVADVDPAVWSTTTGSGAAGARPAAAPGNAGYQYLATDEAGGTLAQSDGAAWNVVGRARSPQSITFGDGVWTNQAVALGELYALVGNRWRVPADLSTATEARLVAGVGVIGHTTAVLCAQFSTDSGATWTNFDGSAGTTACAGAQVSIATLGAKASTWMSLPIAARSDVQVRVVGVGGNAVADPQIGTLAVQAR